MAVIPDKAAIEKEGVLPILPYGGPKGTQTLLIHNQPVCAINLESYKIRRGSFPFLIELLF